MNRKGCEGSQRFALQVARAQSKVRHQLPLLVVVVVVALADLYVEALDFLVQR
jgi:hypothetical protein